MCFCFVSHSYKLIIQVTFFQDKVPDAESMTFPVGIMFSGLTGKCIKSSDFFTLCFLFYLSGQDFKTENRRLDFLNVTVKCE